MNREEFLKTLIESKYPNIKVFSEQIGVPYTTVRTILEKGVGNARVDNVIKICKGLNISPDILAPDFKISDTITNTLILMIKLSPKNQEKAFNYINKLLDKNQ
ncbi:helix-turn-helix domain-containing protein [Latilactobacillus sp. 5-91]|uniref:helix-turn-helix domain-containing protein n=1 Tax=Latilactobacillus sp. 5-91 TaxID=3410924 RepID=UPI003C71233B